MKHDRNLKLAWNSSTKTKEPTTSEPEMTPPRMLAALVVTLCDLDVDLPGNCKIHDPNLAGTVLAMFNLDPKDHVVTNVGNLIFTWAGDGDSLGEWVANHPRPEVRLLAPRLRPALRLVI